MEEENEIKRETEIDKNPKPKAGDILSYTKDVDRYVMDENNQPIKVDNDFQAKCLSLLIQIKQLVK